ncbi:hypothetical protein PF007_g28931 [Phytophthora fragariae]|uniref:Uncharacterized protein n=1 Tax=Phytophthora fragariae TaxID=53985 RepID=A0A6A3PYJ4_9STRA|nr:hypothetical protein PF007_g28931 [Phytophthora fragariae]
MDTVSSLTAQLQLKYPALKTAEDVIMLLRCQIPAKFMERIRRDVGIARQKVEDGKTYTSVPGMLLVEFSRVVGTLKLFAIGIEKSFGCEAVFVGKMVELYGEERTPERIHGVDGEVLRNAHDDRVPGVCVHMLDKGSSGTTR